jgi:hypothetical protein
MSSNSLFCIAMGMCLVTRYLADGHIPAFRRHVTVLLIKNVFETKIQRLRKFLAYVLFASNLRLLGGDHDCLMHYMFQETAPRNVT